MYHLVLTDEDHNVVNTWTIGNLFEYEMDPDPHYDFYVGELDDDIMCCIDLAEEVARGIHIHDTTDADIFMKWKGRNHDQNV